LLGSASEKVGVGERAYEAMIKEHLGGQLIGHISRDGTTIAARERPAAMANAATELANWDMSPWSTTIRVAARRNTSVE
jgi:hypothetical protein